MTHNPFPRKLTWRLVALDLLGLAALALVAHVHPHAGVSMGFWGFLVSIIVGIWDGIQAAADVIGASALALAQWLRGIVFNMAGYFGQGLAFLGTVAKDVAGIFVDLWNDVLKPFVSNIYKWLSDLSKWLKKVLSPVIGFLKGVRDEILKIYDKFVAPVLHVIDVVKGGLQILADLGVKWAAKLEARLTAIEDAIRQPFLDLVDKVNEIIGWVNRVMTADGLFQRLTLFKSLLTYHRDYVNFSINAFVGTPDQGKLDAAAQPYGTYEAPDLGKNLAAQWQGAWTPLDDLQEEQAGALVLLYRQNGMVRG